MCWPVFRVIVSVKHKFDFAGTAMKEDAVSAPDLRPIGKAERPFRMSRLGKFINYAACLSALRSKASLMAY
jgi:hypothetical protein